jgi:hypothetical protein
MTRKQIESLIKTHESHRDYALDTLRRILTEGESQGQEIRWTRLYITHRAMVEALKEEKADDE